MLLDKKICSHLYLLFRSPNLQPANLHACCFGAKPDTHLPGRHACPCEAVWGLQQPQCQQQFEGSMSLKARVPQFLQKGKQAQHHTASVTCSSASNAVIPPPCLTKHNQLSCAISAKVVQSRAVDNSSPCTSVEAPANYQLYDMILYMISHVSQEA